MRELNLLTVEDRVALLVNGLSGERDHKPVVKLFTPDAAAIWLLTECDVDEPDSLFGLCDLGLGAPELGFVSLAEIMEVRGRLGLPVERDNSFVADRPLSAYAERARTAGRIVV
ncbi:DUF2958 domain-containing protein [Tardiphaga sp.]|jgi:hypothetical protein|uniref:DUF2958 domain-containing protein n=1 Tax=Tardiphaga sp. TaxID=1926292 RepID=UPI0037D9ED6F